MTELNLKKHEVILIPSFNNSKSSFKIQYFNSQVALVVKIPPVNSRDMRDADLISGSGRHPGEGHDNLLQYSCHGQRSLMGHSP